MSQPIQRIEKVTKMVYVGVTETEHKAYKESSGGNMAAWLRNMANQTAGVPVERSTASNRPHRRH